MSALYAIHRVELVANALDDLSRFRALTNDESRLLEWAIDRLNAVGWREIPEDELTNVVSEAAREHKVRARDILSPSRSVPIVAARNQAMRTLYGRRYSLAEIGRKFGRDHSTVSHAVKP